MSDEELIRELAEALCNDTTAPRMTQKYDPRNPVDIEIMLHEADFAVESYMEKWRGFRDRFEDPALYDDFVYDYQMRVRRDLKSLIAQAQELFQRLQEQEPEEEPDEDEDWYEGQD